MRSFDGQGVGSRVWGVKDDVVKWDCLKFFRWVVFEYVLYSLKSSRWVEVEITLQCETWITVSSLMLGGHMKNNYVRSLKWILNNLDYSITGKAAYNLEFLTFSISLLEQLGGIFTPSSAFSPTGQCLLYF